MAGRKLLAATICVLSLLFLFGCSHLSQRQPAQPEPPKEFAAMVGKKAELAAFPTSEKLSKKPAIKGKIAIVGTHDDLVLLDRFSEDGAIFYDDRPIPSETFSNFLPPEIYAKNPNEIETLIKISCVSKTGSAQYSKLGESKEETMDYKYVICDIGLIDYKNATLVAKKQVGKNVAPTVINSRTIAKTPWADICEYLRSFPGAEKTSAL